MNPSGSDVITGRNEVVAKVIFLHLFVILFTGGVSAPGGGLLTGGVSVPGGVCFGWVSAPGGGLLWGVYAPQKFFNFYFKFFFKIFFFYFDFLFLLGIPPPPKLTRTYGQRAAGTHPTGMHSCIHFCFRPNINEPFWSSSSIDDYTV